VTKPPQNSLVRIRKAVPDDIPFIMRIERECTTAAHWTEQQYRELFSAAADCGIRRLALVAEGASSSSEAKSPRDATPSGFLIARHLAPEWELENIIVAPSARRMGIGERLLNSLLNAARETHSTSMFLEVRESNLGARALYEKLGFRETGLRKSYYTNPLEDAILYSFDLGQSPD
jgi:[ribosomal protein S18]-alanine N-acetyltransferase